MLVVMAAVETVLFLLIIIFYREKEQSELDEDGQKQQNASIKH
jgi:hypothetical protein